MNISITQANALLAALQVGAAVVADEQQADDANADIATLAQSTVAQLAQQPAVKEQHEAAFTGRHMGALRAAAHRVFGLPRRTLDDLSIEQLLTTCKDNSAAQQDIATLQAQHEQTLATQKNTYEQQLTDLQQKTTQKEVAARCRALLAAMPRKGGDIAEQAEMLQYRMSASYQLRYNEATQQIELLHNGEPALTATSTPVADEDFARQWAARAGILLHDTRHIAPADVQADRMGATYGAAILPTDADAQPLDAIVAWANE